MDDKEKKPPYLEEIQEAMEANMHFQMTYFAKYIPTMKSFIEPDVTIVRSQIVDDTFNYVLSAHFSEENADDRIRDILSLFKESHLPFSWWVSESDAPSTLGKLLQRQGLVFKEKNIGMYLELDLFTESLPPSTLIFQRVESPLQLKIFSDIIVAIGGSFEAFDLIYSKLPSAVYSGSTPLEIHIGYFENVPVVTGMLMTHADVAGIYYIATTPLQRKKGFGSAMMHHLLGRAKAKGYHIATLQASESGYSLYERLGFKKTSQFLEYGSS